jgi:hypothetical protein
LMRCLFEVSPYLDLEEKYFCKNWVWKRNVNGVLFGHS